MQELTSKDVIDLGDIGVLTVQPQPPETSEIKGILTDMEALRDIMLDFGVITEQQGEQLGKVSKHVSDAEINITDGNQDLLKAHELIYKRRHEFMRMVAIIGSGGLGTAGFFINPLVGLGAMLAGGGVGWFVTREETVDTIMRAVPEKSICAESGSVPRNPS
ncbi:hypothetical protein LCGC14_1941460 [marine sediment metagenome]|uniref:t-SNARE coiled-coil homology domain-containing protein n=2 Tax=root TaxID=1 RepID=A0A0F9HYK8_9ZZZZ|nr:MAG: hypothetical protein LCMAC202_06230 [Marseillevirus LCMAC202]